MNTKWENHLADVEASLEGWADERLITRQQILYAYVVDCYLVNLADDAGIEIRGFSFRPSEYLDLLVLKAVVDSEPVVTFVSAKTFLQAFKIFVCRLREGSVEWRHDKFA